jgi:S-formylglutathione hydrolase
MKVLKEHRCFKGKVQFCEHDSSETKTKMKFSTYIPDGVVKGCLIWLSGLTCTEENFITKAGAQKYLAEVGLMIVCPDTSPRGLNLPGEHESIDFGSGAGFYVDATTDGYKDHYRMYSYIANELYALIQKEFNVGQNISIFGHSMGGHGALVIGLREKEKFKSVSAFAPVAHPSKGPWGANAFIGYFGQDQKVWESYDTTELIHAGVYRENEILVDQGSLDPFLKKSLLVQDLVEAVQSSKQKMNIRMQEGYDHSYYFIASFIEDHIRFHAKHF